MISWINITGLGDSVVTLPAAAAITVWLFCIHAWRMAVSWCLLLGIGMVLVLATKIAFLGWGFGIPALDFTGVSGHAMRACAVLPVLAYLATRASAAPLRYASLLLGCILAAVVSLSRIVVHAHSTSEALTGVLLGALVSLSFICLCRQQRALTVPRWLLAIGLLALLPTSQADPAPTSRWVDSLAMVLAGHDRPFQALAADQHSCRYGFLRLRYRPAHT